MQNIPSSLSLLPWPGHACALARVHTQGTQTRPEKRKVSEAKQVGKSGQNWKSKQTYT